MKCYCTLLEVVCFASSCPAARVLTYPFLDPPGAGGGRWRRELAQAPRLYLCLASHWVTPWAGRLREEQARNEALQSRLDSVQAESQTGRSEGARSAAGLEAELCSLRQQLDAYRVQHAEWRSERLRLEKVGHCVTPTN
ncbi:hypothetical protein HaLaN_06024 [Haematococcus lacustris]|uniref:Uncharacterized protein n=1 Tax=Haematococcus lacustris TaxID=44745 RepID=A0A699YSE5_HAELA|nr:hypothetical protein HaLaN_06024 [Haematococcus lacustris]